MGHLNENIKYLRRQKGLTQQQFADLLKIKRSSLGAYEEDRAKPNIEVQKAISKLFDISLDQLLTQNLSSKIQNRKQRKDIEGKNLRVLTVSIGKDKKENIELVSQKAAAGYLNGYADQEYIEELPKFRLPFLPEGTYRAFEINGDSMLPLQSKSIVVAEYVADWTDLQKGLTYIIVSKQEGVVYKRLFNIINEDHKLILHSDNPIYLPIEIDMDELLEVWKAKLFISHASPENNVSMEKMMGMVMQLQHEVMKIKKAKSKI